MPIIKHKNINQPRSASNFSTTSSALTDEDLEARRGCFTGSGTSKLMTKNSKAGSWSAYTPEMVCDFGKVAKDYIFEKVMERKTGIVARMSQTQEMKYGNNHEDDIYIPLAARLLKDEGIVLEKCKFMKIEGQPSAGSTPDGRGYLLSDPLKLSKIAIEIKCCLKAGTLLSRLTTANTEKNIDYWQCISEMMTLKVDRLVYGLGHPPRSFNDPVPNFEICEVRMSKIHANALLDRINLADKIANDFIANDTDYKDFDQSMLKSISEWRQPERNESKPDVKEIPELHKEVMKAEITAIDNTITKEKQKQKTILDDCAW